MHYSRTAILLLMVAGVSPAQEAGPLDPSEHEIVQQLVLQVKALQEKVAALEATTTSESAR